jgi:hypothetical protein
VTVSTYGSGYAFWDLFINAKNGQIREMILGTFRPPYLSVLFSIVNVFEI